MGKYKVAVYAICKNEEQFVERWVESMSEADVIVVSDTGSTDKTVQKLKEKGVMVYTDITSPWRFDYARNKSLDHVPEEIDICVCTDLDEIFEKGWREALEDAWNYDTKMAKYLYNWSLKEDGTPDIQFNYFKAHARHGYRWVYPVHECLRYTGTDIEKVVFVEGMVLNHYPDRSKSRGSYLNLLEMGVEEEPEDDRMRYYLGREYMYNGNWDKCIATLRAYLGLKKAVWAEERCAAMRHIAKAYYKKGDYSRAYSWYYKAISECSHMREPYVECAKMAYELKNWPVVLFMTKQALEIKNKSAVYINMGYCWDYTVDDLAAIASYWLGMYEIAKWHAEAALSYAPDDIRLQRNSELISEKIK